MERFLNCCDEAYRDADARCAGMPLEGDQLQAEVASLIVGGLDTTAQTCSFTLCGISTLLLLCSPVCPLHDAKG